MGYTLIRSSGVQCRGAWAEAQGHRALGPLVTEGIPSPPPLHGTHPRLPLRVEKGDKNGEKENDEEKHGSICWREFFFI